MDKIRGTRRAFVGTAVVGAVAVGTGALLRRGEVETGVELTSAPAATGPVTAVQKLSPEIARWAAAMGAPVRIAGELGSALGTIDMIENAPTIANAPPGVRRNPFSVHFLTERATAPKGDAIYAVTTPVEGMSQLFLQRGRDRGDKALLVALIA